ncbi:P-selectin glycoprotein ligand 1 [Microcaecilia unicolor]|uniref:P-selectin glycoprotein ligand 1 n=1 Tax=Microcaecilia unicolor TaxID=1415580 RepID=A0A6P7ZGS1_9AMPH|nr:P-selectin glycoprotein ligand 1 [Microcaecilia unicolor]
MILKTSADDIATWKSMIEFEESKVSTREKIITTNSQGTVERTDLVEEATATANGSSEPTTENQGITEHIDLVEDATATANGFYERTTENHGTTKFIDLVEEATATANGSSERTTENQGTTEHIDLVEEATATANGSSELTTENQGTIKFIDLVEDATANGISEQTTENHGTTKFIDLVEEATATANGSFEPTTESHGTTKLAVLVENVTTSANGSSELATISSGQPLITSSAFNLSHTQEVESNMTSETTVTHRPGSPTEKNPTHSTMGQCLMAILILAFLATLFIVCTIVLSIKLTIRKDSRLHKENSTEMMCISTLLQDHDPAAERSKLKPRKMKTFAGNAYDSDEDNTTLNSFMPDH